MSEPFGRKLSRDALSMGIIAVLGALLSWLLDVPPYLLPLIATACIGCAVFVIRQLLYPSHHVAKSTNLVGTTS
jgi:hypothetical protein